MPSCMCGKDMFPFGRNEQKVRYVCIHCNKVVTLDPANSQVIIGTIKELGINITNYQEVVYDKEIEEDHGTVTQKPNKMGRPIKNRK